MSTVNHDHTESGALCKTCNTAIRSDNVRKHVCGQSFDRNPIWTDGIAWAPLMHIVLFAFISHISTGIHTRMRQFQARNSSMAVNGISCISGCCQRIQDRSIQVVSVRTIGLRVHHTFTDGNRTSAAFSSQLVKSCGFWTNTTIIGDISSSHRCRKHTITECYPSNGDRTA